MIDTKYHFLSFDFLHYTENIFLKQEEERTGLLRQ